MPKYLQLGIPEPCHEDWHKMSPDAQGRFCGSCQKTLTDFTNMSDAQLVAFFKSPKTSVCGRFNQEQLERDILIPRKRIPWIKYFFQFALPAFLLSLKSSAQMGKVFFVPPVQKLAVEKPSKLLGDTIEEKQTCMPVAQLRGYVGGVSYSVEDTRNISGRVTDSNGNPLPGASVWIQQTNSGTLANAEGKFFMGNVRINSIIVVSSVGFGSKEVKTTNVQIPLDIQLSPQVQGFLGEVVVVGYGRPQKKNKPSKKEVCVKPVEPTLLLYPNPIKSSIPLNLRWQDLQQGNYKIEVYNVAGLLMKSQKLLVEKDSKQTSLPISELVAGNYFVRVINDKTGKQMTEQFIVQE